MAPRHAVNVGVTAHQALYGYDEGHRLLVASTNLEPEDRNWLLRQTDSPDAGSSELWTELMAGYPLPSGRYAWTMTWPAPEMRRPGCVWTHVLILEHDDLSSGAAVPIGAFVRPSGRAPDLSAYRKPLTILDTSVSRREDERTDAALSTVMWVFFEQPSLPTRLSRVQLPDPARHRLLVSPWRVAWPELRACVSVSDAPFTPRTLPDRPFDLQFQTIARRRAGTDERVIDGLPRVSPPRWIEPLVREAENPGELTEFLRATGPLMQCSRDSMAPLVHCWRALQLANVDQDEAAEQLVAATVRALGSAVKPARFIQEIVKVAAQGADRRIDDAALLRALVTNHEASELATVGLDVSAICRRLLDNDLAAVGSVLSAAGPRPTPLGDAVLDAVAAAMNGRLAVDWLDVDVVGLTTLLQRRPMVVSDPSIWRAIGPEGGWDALRRIRGKSRRVATAAALVKAGLPLDAARVAEGWKGTAPAIVDQLVADGVHDARLVPWIATLSSDQRRSVAEAEGPTSSIGEIVVGATSPEELATWDLPFLLAHFAYTEDAEVAAHLYLAAILNTAKPLWAELGVPTYERLHHLAVRQSGAALGQARAALQGVAADAGDEWDVGWRLAKETNRALKRGRWDVGAALLCENEEAFVALIGCDDQAGLARRILDRVLDDSISMRDWQAQALFAVTRQKADRDALAALVERVEGVVIGALRAIRPW